MIKNPQRFWLLIDSNLIQKNAEIIHVNNGVLDTSLDRQLCKIETGTIENIWPTKVPVYITGSRLVDLLYCTPRITAVSDRAKIIIERISGQDVEFLPIDLFFSDGTPFTRMKYWAINVLRVVDAIDLDNSKTINISLPDEIDNKNNLKILKPCFFLQQLLYIHIFKYQIAGNTEQEIYLSKKLKLELEKNNCCIGMDFSPIRTTD